MFLYCSSVHSSFAAFIFFLTSLFTFLYPCTASVLEFFCCFTWSLWLHRFRTLFMTQGWIFIHCLPRISSAVESSTSFRLLARVSTSLSKTQRAANFPPTLAWNTSAILASSEFLQVKQDVRTLHETISFQLLLDGCKHKVIIKANCWPRQFVGVESVGKLSRWLFANSRSVHPLTFVSPIQNFPTVPTRY